MPRSIGVLEHHAVILGTTQAHQARSLRSARASGAAKGSDL
jgi:hypothetical protein